MERNNRVPQSALVRRHGDCSTQSSLAKIAEARYLEDNQEFAGVLTTSARLTVPYLYASEL